MDGWIKKQRKTLSLGEHLGGITYAIHLQVSSCLFLLYLVWDFLLSSLHCHVCFDKGTSISHEATASFF